MTRAAIETRILALFTAGREAEAFNIREIAQGTGAAYPHAYAAVQEMLRDGLLLSSTIGHATYCRANLAHPLARNILAQAALREQLRAKPNAQNVRKEAEHLALLDERILGVIEKDGALRFLVSDKRVSRTVLRSTSLMNVSFATIEELRSELLLSLESLHGAHILFGYERFLLVLAPMQDQLFLNHSSLMRGSRR